MSGKTIIALAFAATSLLVGCDSQNQINDNILIAAKSDGKWGYVNKQGQLIIAFQFDNAHSFTENDLAVVEYKGKWGYLTRDGKFAIRPQFEEAYGFNKIDTVPVKLNGKYRFMDKTGKFIDRPQLDNALPFKNGYAPIWDERQMGIYRQKLFISNKSTIRLCWIFRRKWISGCFSGN